MFRRYIRLRQCDGYESLQRFKDLNLNKHNERSRKDLLIALQLTDLTKCPKCMLFTLRVTTS